MKTATSALALALLATACGKQEVPTSSNMASSSRAECGEIVSTVEAAGIEKLKEGIDGVVKQISQSDADALEFGTRIYRRATPSKYSNSQISNGMKNAITALNNIGQIVKRDGLAKDAPQIDTFSGLIGSKSFSYPIPPKDRQRDDLSIRDQYDGIPVFGVSVGETAADAGFAFIGKINTRIDDVNYEVSLKYTGATKNYVIESHAYKNDLNPVAFSVSNCLAETSVQKWIVMPRSQSNLTECEFGGCKNIPKD